MGEACVDLTTDPANCGACEKACNGAACIGGVCGPSPLQLAAALSPVAIAVDQTNVYFTSQGAPSQPTTMGTVSSVPIAGGAVTVLAPGRDKPSSVAVDGTSVYWLDSGSQGSSGALCKVPIGGGNVTTLASGLNNPVAVTVDATHAYFTSSAGTSLGPNGDVYDSAISKVPLSGGSVTVLASTDVYTPSAIAVDATSVYWIDSGDRSSLHGGVFQIPIVGGTVVTLDSTQFYGAGLAIDSANVYFTTTRGLSKVSKLGGGTFPIAALPNEGPVALAIDSTNLFFTASVAPSNSCTSSEQGTVSRSALGSGSIAQVATAASPGALVVDATNIYWTDASGSGVFKLTK
jgi:hypothetical protein